MSLRRAVSALALLLVAGCGGAEADPSTDASGKGGDAADSMMEQRIAIPQPKLPPRISHPTIEDGATFVRYFIGGSLRYAMRSGFTIDFRREFTFYCKRCRSVWMEINREYKQQHLIEMSPVVVDDIQVPRGPVTKRHGSYKFTYWLVDVRYHVDELSIRDDDGEIASATDLEFVDRLVVSFDNEWEIQVWKSSVNDPGAPILGRPEVAA